MSLPRDLPGNDLAKHFASSVIPLLDRPVAISASPRFRMVWYSLEIKPPELVVGLGMAINYRSKMRQPSCPHGIRVISMAHRSLL